MEKNKVSIVKFNNYRENIRRAIEMCDGLIHLKVSDKVLLKPNLVMWDSVYPFPKYGVITTSVVVEEVVKLLKEYGCSDITLGESSIEDAELGSGTKQAFEGLGYHHLQAKYGLKRVDFNDGPFTKTDFGDFSLNIASQVFESDFIINLPVLKTHSQTKVSLGFKNLKGCLDLTSKIRCHNKNTPLNHYISELGEEISPQLTVIDGIYSLERGPAFNGRAYRSDVIIASRDMFSADVIGCQAIGFTPSEIEYLARHASKNNLPLDTSLIKIIGERLDEISMKLEWDWKWNKDKTAPEALERMGVSGLYYPKYDDTLCSGCAHMTNIMLVLLLGAYKEKPFSGYEFIGGKATLSRGGYDKSFLFGNCAVGLNKNNPAIREALEIRGCPPGTSEVVQVLNKHGIPASMDMYAAYRNALAAKYKDKSGFEEDHFSCNNFA